MKSTSTLPGIRISRRAFVQGSTLWLLGAGCSRLPAGSDVSQSALKIGLVTDLHYAEKQSHKNRFYRESLAKAAEAADRFSRHNVEFVVELGDFIDSTKTVHDDLAHLKTIRQALDSAPGEKHFVLGNHCVETLTKPEFLEAVGQSESHYSFDRGAFHFVVLDACFRSDGTPYGRGNVDWTDANLPQSQLEWLAADLEATAKRTIILAHQRLDNAKKYSVNNAPAVRSILEKSGKVEAVFQGHHHRNDHQEIAGIHYCTLTAMVEGSGNENNGYAILDVAEDGSIRISGFRRQANYRWPA